MIKTLGLLKAGEEVTLDFDHQFIPAHKFDAKYSYKKDNGYFPGWASIGGILIGGENRDGNTNVKFHQADTLIRIMDSVKLVLGITIRNVNSPLSTARWVNQNTPLSYSVHPRRRMGRL